MPEILSSSKAETRLIFAFCVVMAIIPFFNINVPRGMAFIPAITGLVFFGMYAFWSQKKPKISKNTAIFVGTILAISALSILWTIVFDTSKEKVIKLFILLPPQILLISIVTSLTKEQLTPFKKLFPISFLAISFFLIFEIVSKGTLHNIVRGVPISDIADPDDFNRGSTALSMYAFSAFALLSLKYKSKILPLLIFAPLLFAITLCESQSAQLSIIMGLITLFAFPYKSKIAWNVLKIALVLLILTAPFFIGYIYDAFAQTLQDIPIMAQAYAGQRLELWEAISRYALDKPFLGHGIEATRDVTDFDSKRIFWTDVSILHPHNFVIQIWMEFGLLGILTAAFFMWSALTAIEKQFSLSQQKILLPTLMATLVPASFAYGLWQGLWLGLMFHVAAVAFITVTLMHEDSNS